MTENMFAAPLAQYDTVFHIYSLLSSTMNKLLHNLVPGENCFGSAAQAGSTTILGSLSSSSNILSEAPTA